MKQSYDFPVGLGDRVRDTLSGISGTVVALTVYLNKCRRAQVQPDTKRGSSIAAEILHVDTEQLQIVKSAAYKHPKQDPSGGPMPITSAPMPTRRIS